MSSARTSTIVLALRPARPLSAFLLWTIVFALAYAQSPLYTSNQNQYFLHGLARAGVGYLNQDWSSRSLPPSWPGRLCRPWLRAGRTRRRFSRWEQAFSFWMVRGCPY